MSVIVMGTVALDNIKTTARDRRPGMKIKLCLFILGILLTINVHAAEITSNEIFAKTVEVYRNLQTYKADGLIVSNMEIQGMKSSTQTEFNILLKKPNSFLISWKQESSFGKSFSQAGAVWSDGREAKLYIGGINTYSKRENNKSAIAAATGISGGGAYTIPALFFNFLDEKGGYFSSLTDPVIEGIADINGEPCYVLSSPTETSRKVTYWISKESGFILKFARSLELPEGGMDVSSDTMDALSGMKGFSEEYHSYISSPALFDTELQFDLPPGAVYKEDMLGEF
ncbi:hypothetical protein MNBD_BACTEROID05-279 [hydrothermal vent metagenome]|uniref:Outer membrane lipoprotein-sorting protein n=1 Tax=hydrothermal vent metagenome TaxID=652676 RepID=A0A3B0U0D0_9ZZZZ